MLDAYIIERIQQRRRDLPDGAQVPLRIHDLPPPTAPRREEERPRDDESERGSVVIDFSS